MTEDKPLKNIPAIAVQSVSIGGVDIGNRDGIMRCFSVYASGHAPDTTPACVDLVIFPEALPDFITKLVTKAREVFPDDMKDVPPL